MNSIRNIVCYGLSLTVCFVGIISLSASDNLNKFKPVPTKPAEVFSAASMRIFPGVVRAYRRVDLGFNVSGQLEYLNAAEGTRFRKGDLIARLDPRDFQFRLDTANASYKQAKAEYDRKKKLYDEKVISESEIDMIEARFLHARAQRDIAKKALEDTSLFAPFDAVVAKRNYENFAQITAKKTVITLHDIDEVEVVINVPELLFATTEEEDVQSIMVRFDAAANRVYSADLGEFRLTPNLSTRTYEATVLLDSPDDLRILSGMTAAVEISLNSALRDNHSVRVPSKAVFSLGTNTSYVWVVPDVGGRVEKRVVVTGQIVGADIEIVSGLNKGELVAIAGVHSLEEGQAVRPSKEKSEGLGQ